MQRFVPTGVERMRAVADVGDRLQDGGELNVPRVPAHPRASRGVVDVH